MGNAARKARKAAGIKLEKQQKVATPIELRAENQPIPRLDKNNWKVRTGFTRAADRRLKTALVVRAMDGQVDGYFDIPVELEEQK